MAQRTRLVSAWGPGRLAIGLMVVSACAAAADPPTSPITVTDDSGAVVSLDRPARRIVTLAPSLTELVYAVGAGDAMVGTVDSSDYPAAARSVPRIGDYQRLDIERIVGLKPDLVLVWQHGNSSREVAQLESLGIRLFRLEPRRLDEVAVAIEKVGRLSGFDAAGIERARALRAELAALRRARLAQPPVRVFYQAWSRPLMTLGGGQLTNDVIELCGGVNVFAGLASPAPQVSTEAVVAASPQAILAARASKAPGVAATKDAAVVATPNASPLVASPSSSTSSSPSLTWRAPRDPAFAAWSVFATMPAVAHGWMFLLPADELVRAGPRIAEGARAVCEALDVVRAERR